MSYACPWASRAIIYRRLKGLEEVISMTVVDPVRDEKGWRFFEDEPDPINGFEYVGDAYRLTDPDFSGRVTVPLLWDKQTNQAVNNESSEIIRMLNSEFNQWAKNPDLDFYPEPLRPMIDSINHRVYNSINNGVYRCGFATSQEAYEESFIELFETLDEIDDRLGEARFLTGSTITEADWRLFVTLVRFDAVYVSPRSCRWARFSTSTATPAEATFNCKSSGLCRMTTETRAAHKSNELLGAAPIGVSTIARWKRNDERAIE